VRPLTARASRVLDLGHANHELRQVVDRTNFKSRSKLLVEEIAAAARPARLQKVVLWPRTMQLDHIGRTDATEVDYDFLAI
jgi:hypothetical protein